MTSTEVAPPASVGQGPDSSRHVPVRSRDRWGKGALGWLAVLLVVGFLVWYPIVQLERNAFASGLDAFRRMADLPRIGDTIRSTAILALLSSVIAVTLGTCLAWCAATLPPRLRAVGQLVPLLPLVVPAVAAVTGWIFLLSPNVGYINTALRATPFFDDRTEGPLDVYSLPGIVLITGLLLTSFVFLYVHTGLRSIGQEYEAAAAVSGAGPAKRFFTITLPLLRPSIVQSAGVVFLLGLGQFTAPLLLGRNEGIDVLTTEMYRLTLDYPIDYGLGAALGTPLLLAGIVLIVAQKRLIGDQRRFVTVSARSRNDVRRSHGGSAVVIALYALLTTVLPLLALVYVAFSRYWSGTVDLGDLTIANFERVFFERPQLTGAIWTSVKTATMAVAIVIPLGFACAYAALQSTKVNRWTQRGIDVTVGLPIAIPAALFGFAMLFAYTRPPFQLYGTAAILVVTYVTLMLPHGTRLQLSSLIATGQEFREASRACGAGPIRTFFFVLLPMARKGIGAAAAIMFVLLFHEFTASLMVRSTQTQVMGSILYDIYTGGLYPEVAVMALLMVVVTMGGVALATVVGGSDALEKM